MNQAWAARQFKELQERMKILEGHLVVRRPCDHLVRYNQLLIHVVQEGTNYCPPLGIVQEPREMRGWLAVKKNNDWYTALDLTQHREEI